MQTMRCRQDCAAGELLSLFVRAVLARVLGVRAQTEIMDHCVVDLGECQYVYDTFNILCMLYPVDEGKPEIKQA